jgi:hypothetical protein
MHTADHPVLEDELGTNRKSARKTLTLNRHDTLQGPLLAPLLAYYGPLTYMNTVPPMPLPASRHGPRHDRKEASCQFVTSP